MLDEDTKQEINTRLKAVATAMPGFRARPGQRVMIAEVAKAFGRCPDPLPADQAPSARPPTGQVIACIQGGTGIGKSLGYSLPGVILARRKGKKLVIATATVALQEQLMQKDLPAFFEAAGISASIELAKGRTRYVCNYRLRGLVGELAQDGMFGREERPGRPDYSDPDNRRIITELAEALSSRTWNGDRDTRPGIPEDIWNAATTDRNGCLGRRCPLVRECAQLDARKRLKTADVVVANHDLVLADLAMGGGKILPAPGDSFYVFDEGGQLPEKAVSSFAAAHLVGADRRIADRVPALARAMTNVLGTRFAANSTAIVESCDTIEQSLGEAFGFFDSLAGLKPTPKNAYPRLEMQASGVPEEFTSLGINIVNAARTVVGKLAVGLELLAETDPSQRPIVEKIVADAGFFVTRFEQVADTWDLFMQEPDPKFPPIAKWVEFVPLKRGNDYKLCASPVRVGGRLRALLWEKAAGAVVTSATLTAMGEFRDFLVRSGLDAYPDVPCVAVPSPFDFRTQGVIEIPQMRALPKDVAAHTEEVTERVDHLIASAQGVGVLVLFTSRAQMAAVAGKLSPSSRKRVFVQGDGSKGELIRQHKDRVDRGETSAILGLESFAEGVDLPGRYCATVVITRLPFDVPDDPVIKALSSWIEDRGGKPFFEVLVPAAARKLEQRVGRLIRTESDTGTVVVLDQRLWDMPYGRQMLRGLPPFRLVVKGKEAVA